MNNTTAYAPPKMCRLEVSPEWARLLARLQQLRPAGGLVLIDLSAMTLAVVGRNERILTKAKTGIQSQ